MVRLYAVPRSRYVIYAFVTALIVGVVPCEDLVE
jgi:hypothetical protein